MNPIKERYCIIRHKIINEQPLLEVLICDDKHHTNPQLGLDGKALDCTVLRPTENLKLTDLIMGSLYG